MNILIAPDKFKGTLSSLEVCAIVEDELKKNFIPQHNIKSFPLADGGDGTADVLQYHLGGQKIELKAHDPLMRPVTASYLLTKDGNTAFIEMARVSGLVLLKPNEQNPLHTTTYGTGELIRDALTKGAKQIFLGIGGSATNDGGTGALAALGVRFLNKNGSAFIPTGGTLEQITDIDFPELYRELKDVAITALCDVSNPFTGKDSAARMFAPQKGADEAGVQQLEKGMEHLACLIKRITGVDLNQVPGSGAGGGIAGGLHALLGAKLKPGIQSVMALTRFEDALQWADLVITGEGKIDQQTLKGKLVMGVVKSAQNMGKLNVVVCGICELSSVERKRMGAQYLFELTQESSLSQSLANPALTLKKVVQNYLIKLIKAC